MRAHLVAYEEDLTAAEKMEVSKQDDGPDLCPKGQPAVAMKRPAGNRWEASPAKAAATMPPPATAPKAHVTPRRLCLVGDPVHLPHHGHRP